MSPLIIGFIALSAFVTALLSGVFGMAGGLAYFQTVTKPAMIKGFIQKAGQPTSSVAAQAVKTETWTPTLTAIGSLRATQGVEIAPQVGGVVRAIRFESSQDIKKGALLVEIDDSTEQADLKANQAALQNTQATLDRQSKLVSGGNTTQASLDQATAARDQAAAAVERTKAIIAQKRIVAPFDGHVTGEEALDALLASVPPAGRLQGVRGRMEAVFLETPPHDDVSAMLVDVRKL